MKKYFHELSLEEFEELVKKEITYAQLENDYPKRVE